ncbi:MFS transporter, partial [Pseudomonas syringae]
MGIYSTSQFLGVAIGGSMGGWVFQHVDAQAVFLLGAGIAILWLLVSLTMQEPPYVSSLRVVIPHTDNAELLEQRLRQAPGV